MILIIGSKADPHIEAVCQHLDKMCSRYSVLDFFDESGAGIRSNISERSLLKIGGGQVAINDFDAVWWRLKPSGRHPTHTLLAYYDYQFVQKEWTYLCGFLEAETTHAFSINDRSRAKRADDKLLQLKMAERVGLKVPRTLVSNQVEAVLEFMESSDSEYIFKTLTPYMPPDGRLTFTSVIRASDIVGNSSTIASAPGIYQELVRRQFELRITVIGDRLFAAKIAPKSSDLVDWRREIFTEGMYKSFKLSDRLTDQILDLHSQLGLFYAAYDVIINLEGEPVFLELNPGGQWLWLEHILGHPISREISVALTKYR